MQEDTKPKEPRVQILVHPPENGKPIRGIVEVSFGTDDIVAVGCDLDDASDIVCFAYLLMDRMKLMYMHQIQEQISMNNELRARHAPPGDGPRPVFGLDGAPT
jgi:hypothetical protein